MRIILLLFFGQVMSCIANAQTFDWAKSMEGSSGTDQGLDIVVDKAGNAYVTGYFRGTADFDPGPGTAMLNSAGGNDVFLAKYDANGNYVWAINMGGLWNDYGYGLTLDTSGNVYIIGYFSDSADFDPGTGRAMLGTVGGAYDNDVFVGKYDSNGNYVWVKDIGSIGTDNGFGIAMDRSGYIYITGFFEGVADFDPGPKTSALTSAGDYDIFVAKYDASGNYVWAKNMGGGNSDQGLNLITDDKDNVYVTGYFSGTADFDPGAGTSALTAVGGAYDRDAFIAKYDKNGNYIWAVGYGGNSDDLGQGIAVDGHGNILVTGQFNGTADFDPGPGVDTLTAVGGIYDRDGYVAKYDTGGNYMWAKNMGGSSSDFGWGIACDGSGNVYVTGTYWSTTVDFDPRSGTGTATLSNAGSSDAFLVKYNARGNYIWAGNMGGSGADQGYGVTVDKSGNVYVTGNFSDTADFDPGPKTFTLTSAGSDDIFILKLACSDTSSSYLTVSTCEGSYTLNDSIYSYSGTYTQVIPNAAGCDSTVTLDLTFYQLDPIITIDSFTLSTTDTYATYQWIKDNALIPGATDSKYIVTANGNYQVVVTNEEGCSDTSDVYPVNNYTGIKDVNALTKQIWVYPNPSDDWIYIQFPVLVNAALVGIEGKVIYEIKNAHKLSVKDLAAGIYLLRIEDKDGALIKMEKIVKQ